MNFRDIVASLVGTRKEALVDLLDKKTFETEAEMEQYLVAKLPAFLGVPSENVHRQWVLQDFKGKETSRADIVVFSKYSSTKIYIVFELKLEKTLAYNHDDEKNFDEAYRKLNTYCQDCRAEYGVILTEKRCWFYTFDFQESVLKSHSNLPIMIKPQFMDAAPDKIIWKYVLIFWLIIIIFTVLISIISALAS